MTATEKIDIAILCPIREEFEVVRLELQNPVHRRTKEFDLSYDYGLIKSGKNNWRVALFETGKGVGNMQMNASNILYTTKPKYIFLVGIAGGVKDAGIGDVVIAEKAYGYEYVKVAKEGNLVRPETESPPPQFLSLVRQWTRDYEREKDTHQIILGTIASGEKVLAHLDAATVKLIRRAYSDTQAVEMEAIGFYKAVRYQGVDFLNIRGVSDLIGGKDRTETDGSRLLAAENATQFLLYLLKQLPKLATSEKALPIRRETKVRYLSKPNSRWGGLQNPAKGILVFSEQKITLEQSGESLEIVNIKSMERYKMPGDFKANWVKVIFADQQQLKTLFFSEDSQLPGWGALFGGSTKLYQNFQRMLKE